LAVGWNLNNKAVLYVLRISHRIKLTGIGSWSKDIFIQRFKSFEGKEKQAAKLSPGDPQIPMPWYMYAGMKANDLAAIYAYLRTVKPIKNQVIAFQKF